MNNSNEPLEFNSQKTTSEQSNLTPNQLTNTDSININDNRSNIGKDSKKKEANNSFIGFFIIIISLIGFALFLIGNEYGLVVGVICLLLSLFESRKSPPFIFSAIVFSVALVAAYVFSAIMVHMFEEERLFRSNSSVYIDIARSYINSARTYNRENNIINCSDVSKRQEHIKLNKLDSSYADEKPFDNNIDTDNSFVEVRIVEGSNKCVVEYSIFITDGEYAIGKDNNPVKYEDIELSSIIKEK